MNFGGGGSGFCCGCGEAAVGDGDGEDSAAGGDEGVAVELRSGVVDPDGGVALGHVFGTCRSASI